MILLSIILQFAIAECNSAASLKDLSKSLDAMSIGFANRDLEALQQNIGDTEDLLPCVNEVITPEVASRLHLLYGLYYWISQSPNKADQSFSIAKSIRPDKTIETYLFAEDHTIHEIYAAVSLANYRDIDTPLQDTQHSYFDGKESQQRPKDSPTLFQIEENQQIVLTQYLTPYMAVSEVLSQLKPTEVIVEPPVESASEQTDSTKGQRQLNSVLLIAVPSVSLVGSYSTAISLRRAGEQNDSLWISNQVFFASFVLSTSYLVYHYLSKRDGFAENYRTEEKE